MLKSVCFDCARPAELARFWAAALGDHVVPPSGDGEPDDGAAVVIVPASGGGPSIWFNRVPEPKSGKNRVHVDVTVAADGGIERLLRLGATVLREPGGDVDWWVLADPEGNEFCAFT